jgi:hypothetical protein
MVRLGRSGPRSNRGIETIQNASKNKKFAKCRSDINIVMKNDMKVTDYYKSGKHKENVLKARAKATEASTRNKQARVNTYNENPTLCKCCNSAIGYNKRKNVFCSKSCAATYNNTGRVRTDESKQKTGKSILSYHAKMPPKQKKERKVKIATERKQRAKSIHPDVEFTCPICKGKFMIPYIKRHRKTCGDDNCVVYAKVGIREYQNGSRKPVWFYNPTEGKEVLLDSSWEVKTAELLIAKSIKWIRPPFIKWQDKKGKTRRYFPDFYLPDYDVYLDPKNPYCLTLDEEKIREISKQVILIVGSLDTIKDYIKRLT